MVFNHRAPAGHSKKWKDSPERMKLLEKLHTFCENEEVIVAGGAKGTVDRLVEETASLMISFGKKPSQAFSVSVVEKVNT
jgi:preprotein translocase subunit YajC